MHFSISDQYFGFQALGRPQPGLPPAPHEHGETTVYRTACGALPCSDGEPKRDGYQIVVRMVCRECTNVSKIGYGSKPARAAGLWLHPGPPFVNRDDHGPEAHYVTGSKDSPSTREDVIGLVGWKIGKRGGKVWWAGYGPVRELVQPSHLPRCGHRLQVPLGCRQVGRRPARPGARCGGGERLTASIEVDGSVDQSHIAADDRRTGTHFQNRSHATYEHLLKVSGRPEPPDPDRNTRYEWLINTPAGVATVASCDASLDGGL